MRVASLVLALVLPVAACGGGAHFAPDSTPQGTVPCDSCGGTAGLAMRWAMLGVIVGSTVYGMLAQR